MKEYWKTVPEYPLCEASSLGRIRYKESVKLHPLTFRMRPLKLTGFGYYQTTYFGATVSVHNLVAMAFLGPRPDKSYIADHLDENKLNNAPWNLRWLPHCANVNRGTFIGNRRYFYEGELWLFKRLLNAGVYYITLGKMFKCSTMLVQDVKKGLKDTHLREADGMIRQYIPQPYANT